MSTGRKSGRQDETMDYRPKPREWFNAFHKRLDYKANGCPCQVRRTSDARVEAVDSNEMDRLFYRHIWRFEKVEK